MGAPLWFVAYLETEKVLYSFKSEDFRRPVEIATDLYIEGNLSSQAKMNMVNKLAESYQLDSQDIQFLIRSKEKKMDFDINNEDTYGSIAVGLLAFELFRRIFELGNITDEEIEELKGREYSKQLFSRTDYPILANNRADTFTSKKPILN